MTEKEKEKENINARLKVVQVLRGQSPDYWIYPDASAFAAEGLTENEVVQALDELESDGLVQREEIPVIVRTGVEKLVKMSKKRRLAHVIKGTTPEPDIATFQGGWRLKGD